LVPLATCGGGDGDVDVDVNVDVEVATATETPATLATVAPVPFVMPRPSINTTYIHSCRSCSYMEINKNPRVR